MIYMVKRPVVRNKHIVPKIKANIVEDLLVKLTGYLKGQLISKVLVFISINPKVQTVVLFIIYCSIQNDRLLSRSGTKPGGEITCWFILETYRLRKVTWGHEFRDQS